MEDDLPVSLATYENNSFFSIVEVYINNQQYYNSNALHAHKSYISINFTGAISEYEGLLHCEGYDYEEFPDQIIDAPLSEPFFTSRIKSLEDPMV